MHKIVFHKWPHNWTGRHVAPTTADLNASTLLISRERQQDPKVPENNILIQLTLQVFMVTTLAPSSIVELTLQNMYSIRLPVWWSANVLRTPLSMHIMFNVPIVTVGRWVVVVGGTQGGHTVKVYWPSKL